MTKTLLMRLILSGVLLAVLGTLGMTAAPRPLSDSQLDAVYAAGFEVKIDFGIDLAATNPDAVIVEGGDASSLQQLTETGLNLLSVSGGSRNSGSFDPTGSYMPNLQNLTVNNINITDNALQNATTLMNVFALEGDVAIGVNLNVVVNPINSPINVTQTNINWGMVNLSSALATTNSLGID